MRDLTLYHHNSKLKSIKEFMDFNLIYESAISQKDFFEYNRKTIFSQMSINQKAECASKLKKKTITEKDLSVDMLLPCPLILKIGAGIIRHETAISQTNFNVNTDDLYAFENEEIQSIIQNEGYITPDKGLKKLAPNCTVYGWFKSFYYAGELNGTKNFYRSSDNDFQNISKYIINISTNVSSSGGSFSITLPIINSMQSNIDVELSGQKTEEKLSYKDSIAVQKSIYNFGENDSFFFHKGGVLSMEQNYFNWLISSNDLIFISFEDLQMEKTDNFKVFDMIGLVESVTVSQNASGQGEVTVYGKDLMKLLTDDSSLFFNYSSVSGESMIFSNAESVGKQGDIRSADMLGNGNGSSLRRIMGDLDVFAKSRNRTIEFVLKGVVSQLANIEVVPDYIFSTWGERRTKFSELKYDENEGGEGNGGGNGNSAGDGGEANKDKSLRYRYSNKAKSNAAFSTGTNENFGKNKEHNMPINNKPVSISEEKDIKGVNMGDVKTVYFK